MGHHLPDMIECIRWYACHNTAEGPLLKDPALGGNAEDLIEEPIMPCILLTTDPSDFQSPNMAIFF
jgi:hypothetical protein